MKSKKNNAGQCRIKQHETNYARTGSHTKECNTVPNQKKVPHAIAQPQIMPKQDRSVKELSIKDHKFY